MIFMLEDIHSVQNLVHTAICLLILLFVLWLPWFLFFKPYNLYQDVTSYGFDQVKSNQTNKKKAIINQTLRRRKLGILPPPFPNSWYAALESDKLEPNQVAEVFILGRNLVAWRGEHSGQAFLADAYCPHLGANLSVGGKVKGNCIECPFHKWRFDGLDGHVVNVPYTKQQLCGSKLPGIKLWHVVEANGFIWVWYHAQDIKPTWFPEENQEIASGIWKYRGRSEFEVSCHIQEIPENGADVAHLKAIHESPSVFFNRSQRINDMLSVLAKHIWSADWRINPDPKHKHESIIEITHHVSLFKDKLKLFHVCVNVRQIGAGIVMLNLETPFGRGVLIQCVTPIEPLHQKIVHRFYSETKFIQLFSRIVLHAEAVQLARDIEIWNRKCYLSQPNLLREDSNIKLFRRWFSQFYSTNEEQILNYNKSCNKEKSLEF